MPDSADPRTVRSADHVSADPAQAAGPAEAAKAAQIAGTGVAETGAPAQPLPPPTSRWTAAGYSRIARLLATVLVFASFLLMSPPRGEGYPGARPWSDFSLLRPVTDLISLYGLLSTERGTEIKDFVFHLAAAAGLGLLALRLATGARTAGDRRLSVRGMLTEPWLAAQLLLIGWVAISALSAFWSGDPALSYSQAILYALALGWALSLAWTLQPQDVPKLLTAIAGACTAAAVLCVWYYYERNPYHRPGFPVGNPITLAITIAPGILICISVLAAALENMLKGQRPAAPRATIAAAAALVPLLWCFLLADSRSAAVGLVGGILAMALLRAGRRLRWAVIGVAAAAALAGGLWLTQYSRLDAAMGRGATLRFRFYTWRYAAELWDRNWFTAVAGNGAGSFPRLAGQNSLRDRRFDPNAFMGDMVEHAHNELFEVLSEIGLVGGVTFVGGFLATLIAGGVLLRRQPGGLQSWLYTGLLAALIALMIDACFSPSLRLPVAPAIFFTLAGTLWALCRAAATEPGTPQALPAGEGTTAFRAAPALMPALGVGVLALGAAHFAVQNWSGVMHEEAGREAAVMERYDAAYQHRAAAAARVLDPARILIDDALAGQALLNGAVAVAQQYVEPQPAAASAPATGMPASSAPVASGPTTEPVLTPAQDEALRRGLAAFAHAVRLGQRAPTILAAASLQAGAAQLLSELYATLDAGRSAEWARRAARAWLAQRNYRPYDFQALLMLTTYRWPAPEGLRLLCDALRAPDAHTLAGQPLSFDQMRSAWRRALQRLETCAGFDEALEHALAVVGPLHPQTDIDTLINSRAPEVYRVAACIAAQQGDFSTARKYAARAVALYEPMRLRFPTLCSAALLEQAEFALLEDPANAPRAADLLQQAISRLPVIQEQKQEALLQPYRRLLVMALLAQGQESQASARLPVQSTDELHTALADGYVELARLYLRQPRQRRPDVEPWLAAALRLQPDNVYAWSWRAWLAAEAGDRAGLDAILKAAAAAGVSPSDAAHIRNSLCQEFPGFCGGGSGTH